MNFVILLYYSLSPLYIWIELYMYICMCVNSCICQNLSSICIIYNFSHILFEINLVFCALISPTWTTEKKTKKKKYIYIFNKMLSFDNVLYWLGHVLLKQPSQFINTSPSLLHLIWKKCRPNSCRVLQKRQVSMIYKSFRFFFTYLLTNEDSIKCHMTVT